MSISYFFRGNLAPLVTSLTVAPASVASGSNVTFSCAATDLDGSVVSVEYFLDSASKGVSTTAAGGFPLTFAVIAMGNNRLTQAQATDNLGVKSLLFSSNALSVTGATSVTSQVGGLTLSAPTTSSLVASWSLPANGGAAITDYLVEYSSNGGTSYAAFLHTASTALTQTITGLAANTNYLVRVSATNSVGTGAASAVMALSTSPAQTLTANISTPS